MTTIESIEQKAKAYDEAIERAKDLHDNHALGMPFIYQTCEQIFPELKESEDEKIRKELLQIVKENEDSFYMVMTPSKRKHLISLLEKQGKQKPAWSEEDERIKYNLIKYCGLCRSMSCCDRDRVDEAIAWLKFLKERM